MEIKEISGKEFDLFSEKHSLNNFRQNSYWGKLKRTQGYEEFYILFIDKGKSIGGTMLLSKKIFFKSRIFYAPRGYLIDYQEPNQLKEVTELLTDFVKKRQGIILKCDPYISYKERDINAEIVEDGINNENLLSIFKELGYKHKGLEINKKFSDSRWISVLDIKNKDIDEIRTAFEHGCKNRINKLLKDKGIKIEEIDKQQLTRFCSIIEHTSQRRNFKDNDIDYYNNLYDIFVKNDHAKFLICYLDIIEEKQMLNENIKVLENSIEELDKKDISDKNRTKETIRINEELDKTKQKLDYINNLQLEHGDKIDMAGALFIFFGDEVVYLASGAYSEYMSFNPQYLIQWEMINYSINHKYSKYNFWGISGNFDKDNPRYGVYAFKRGFNAKVVELIGEFDFIINPLIYNFYRYSDAIKRRIKRFIK